MPATAIARELRPASWSIDLAGPLDATGQDALADALGVAAAARPEHLALHLGGVSALDGGGLSLLVRFAAWCRELGLRPRLAGLTPRARRVFAEQGLEAAMTLAPAGADGGSGAAGPDREFCPPEAWACGLGRVPAADPAGVPLPDNVAGRTIATPVDGFGELWHKVYSLRLGGLATAPPAAAAYLHEHLGELWPPGNQLRLVGAESRLVPGAVGHIRLRLPGGVPLSTGVRVLHVSPTSLTFVTLAGHLEAGWITFGAHADGETTVVRVESLARTGDPLFEMGFLLFGHGQQEGFWRHTLAALARRLGVAPRIQVLRTCVDPSRNWDGARNLTANAALHTGASPLLRRLRGRRP